MPRAESRRRVPRGAASRAFPAAHLLAAAHTAAAHAADCVYVEVSAELVVEEGARAAAAARLAPHHAACNAALELVARGGGGEGALLRLRVLRDLPPRTELLLWLDEGLLRAARVPHLALHHIRGRRDYVCDACGARYEHPNHLKAHLYLACRTYEPRAFWRRLLAELQGDQPSALQPYASPAPPASPVSPATLEALATAWGRAAGGHLCLYCGKLYSRKYGLKIHIRTHTGYKPLRCAVCARAFGDPSNLNKHVRLHSARGGAGGHGAPAGAGAAARHACALCGKALARRRDLERHLRARHACDTSLASV